MGGLLYDTTVDFLRSADPDSPLNTINLDILLLLYENRFEYSLISFNNRSLCYKIVVYLWFPFSLSTLPTQQNYYFNYSEVAL